MTAKEIKNLTIPERLQLVEEIRDSIAVSPEEVPITAAQRAELKRRMEAYESAPREGASWEQVKAGLQRP